MNVEGTCSHCGHVMHYDKPCAWIRAVGVSDGTGDFVEQSVLRNGKGFTKTGGISLTCQCRPLLRLPSSEYEGT